MPDVMSLQRDITIKIPRLGEEIIFKMKELSSSDVWTIDSECIETRKNPDGTIEPFMNLEKRNKLYLSKSITEPSQTMESIGTLPPKVSAILIRVFNQIHVVDEDDLKKTTTQ